VWDIIDSLEKAGRLPEPQPILFPDFWQLLEKRLTLPSIPSWLTPGEEAWDELVARVGIRETQARRRIALQHVKLAKIAQGG
jgi:hypothetical protein